MKKLLIIRHAHAGAHTITDFERPLTKDGIKDAEAAGINLKTKPLFPEIIISSTALRAKTTAGIIAKHLNLAEPTLNADIYEASEKKLLHIIEKLPNNHDFIALTGHNPGLSQVVYTLTGRPYELATCAMALIQFDIDDWQMITADSGDLAWVSSPD